jgi:hypothetical protein
METAKENMQNNLQSQWNEYQRLLQEDPLNAGLVAFSAGLLFSLVPIHRLIGLLLKLVLFAIKPTLLVLGGIKAFEYAQQYGNKDNPGS